MSRCTCFAVPGLPGAAHLSGCPLCEPDTPVDWPARFRAAAEVVEANGRWPITAQHFDDIADRLESGLLPPHLVEAIGRALLGEDA